MKQTYNFILIALLIIGYQCQSQTQECTIFLKDGDSIEGLGMIKNNKIKFSVSQDSEDYLWDFENIKKIKFVDNEITKTYEYVKLNSYTDPQLIELVVEGEVSLYRKKKKLLDSYLKDPTNMSVAMTPLESTFEYYLKRAKDEYPTCINCEILKSWTKSTSNFLSDCDLVVKKIKNHEYSFSQIKEIVESYNDFCTEL